MNRFTEMIRVLLFAMLISLLFFEVSNAQLTGSVYRCYKAADIDSAMVYLKKGKVTKISIEQTDIVYPQWAFPYQWPGNSKMLVIELNGTNTFCNSMYTELPPDQKTAEDVGTQFKVLLINGMLTGDWSDTLVNFACWNGVEISNVRLRKAKVGVHLSFNMNAVVYHCDATGLTGTAFVANRLYITGSNNYNSCSNNYSFIHDRVHNGDSCFASFASYAANNGDIYKPTIEGKKPQYGVYQDDQGSPTVKLHTIYGSHCETETYRAMFYSKLNEGNENVINGWNQKKSPFLIDINSGAGCTVTLTNSPNMLASDRFRGTSTVKWNFYNNKHFDMSTAFGGLVPNQYDYKDYFQNGSNWYNKQGKLNGFKLVTSDNFNSFLPNP